MQLRIFKYYGNLLLCNKSQCVIPTPPGQHMCPRQQGAQCVVHGTHPGTTDGERLLERRCAAEDAVHTERKMATVWRLQRNLRS